MEYQKENNIKKTEIITILNGYTYEKENPEVNHVTEIKRENSSFNSTYIDSENNHIEFERVVIKMEREDQYFEENVEESFDRPLVNKDEIKSVIRQNDIHLTASAIMEENINQDYEEHFCEKIDNILEARDSINDNMQIKIEENYDYSLYSEICANDPLVSQDEIKIDIVDNDIESVNGEWNNEYKIENIEEFSKEHVMPLESEDKTDKEVNFSYKILKAKQEKTLLSKKSKQKLCGAVNRKDKIVKKHECSICKKNFPQSSSLEYHMRIHTGDKPNICDICQRKFSNLSKLRYHMTFHSGEKPHECNVCKKKFTQSSDLKKHMRIHTGEKPYECDICHKKFNESSNLVHHKRIHTGEKLYTCEICQKKFSWSTDLRIHMRIHTREKPYECDVCQKKFIQLSNLIYHKKIHTGENLHECSVCQKKFRQSSHLRTHTLIHTGVKPYECDVCQKKFTRPFNLKIHMLNHTGGKPHECDVCQQMFSQASDLRKHTLIHTGEKSHGCDVCQKKFIRLDYLKKHMRIHIGERKHNNIVISNEIQ